MTGVVGRPTVHTPEVVVEIIRRIAEGQTLVEICRDPAMPGRSTVCRWLGDNDPRHEEFRQAMAIMRRGNAFFLADEIVEISDDGARDMKTVQRGESEVEVVDTENIQRSKLKVDTRKFIMGKFAPDVFGDRMNIAGVPGAPLETKELDPLSRDTIRRIAFLLTKPVLEPEPGE